MAFVQSKPPLETTDQERERLARSPEGSQNHRLPTLSVNIHGCPKGLLIELPWSHRVVVVPIEFRPPPRTEGRRSSADAPRRRFDGSWICAVVASEHASYPVGGHHVVVHTAELVRGAQIGL